MSFIQIFLLLFIIFAASRTILRLKDKIIRPNEFIFWMFLWIAIAAVVILPDITSRVAQILGVGRGADLVIYVSIAIMFYLIFRLIVKIDRVDQEITKIVREIALKSQEQNNKKTK